MHLYRESLFPEGLVCCSLLAPIQELQLLSVQTSIMDFSELVKIRQSVRHYDSRPVEREKIVQCLEAARLAPSASNSQPWYFIIVDDPGLKNRVAEATFDSLLSFNRFTMEAPVIAVLVTEKSKLITRLAASLKERDFSLIDSGIAAAHFCLRAAELELGTCMIGWFNQTRIRKILSIPSQKTISLLITLGYPPSGYRLRLKTRKPPGEMSGWNRYNSQT